MKQNKLLKMNLSIYLTLVVFIGQSMARSSSEKFQGESCIKTPKCICKWSGGKRVADCSNAQLTKVPNTLSSDIQSLILDGNPLLTLDKNVFKSAGLLNLHRLSLHKCSLVDVHEDAFRDLKILIELDMSFNNLTKLRPKTFAGNDNLQTMKLTNNPISSLSRYQFPPLSNLKSIDVSNCRIRRIDNTAFKNLGESVESIMLNNNQLTTLAPDVLVPLLSLKKVPLHSNPWKCDCKLKHFRDWLIAKKLYARPTACHEPARLHLKTWDRIDNRDFACKPTIDTPNRYVFGQPQIQNVSLPCRITGSPQPQARWVKDGRIINNQSRTSPFSSQIMYIYEDGPGFNGEWSGSSSFSRWYNLTITNPSYDNLGEYLCVAENNGGVMESKVTLTFDDPSNFIDSTAGHDERMTVIIGATAASILFILLMIILIIIICCCCRKKRGSEGGSEDSYNGKKLQNNQLNNSYPYQYQQTSTGQNGNGIHSNGNGKVPYSELENGHVENYRRHHSNKMGVEYQGLLSPEETDSLLMERTMEGSLQNHPQFLHLHPSMRDSSSNEVEMQEFVPQHQQIHSLQQNQRASSNPSSSTSPTPMGMSGTNSRPHTSASSGCTPTDGTGSIHSGMGSSQNSTSAVLSNSQTDPTQITLVEHQTPSPPDLLEQTNPPMISPGFVMVNGGAKFKKTSTPMNLNAATLARTGIGCASVGAPSPVPSTISSVAGGISPFQRSGTLPLHYGHHVSSYNNPHQNPNHMCQHYHNHHPRSISCDHSNSQNHILNFHPHASMGMHGVVGLPASQPAIKTQGQRPGYVTMPRRPKNASWSSGAGASSQQQGSIPPYLANQLYATLSRASSTTPTPHNVINSERDPIYDGVGPRTSADGSSKLNLSSTMPRPQKRSLPANGINGNGLAPILKMHGHSPQPLKGIGYGVGHLPPYCAPIQELQDENAPPTPQATRNKSAPNMLDANSDDNLLDLGTPNGISNGEQGNILPMSNKNQKHGHPMADSSITTSGSEQTLMEENISGYCEPFGTAILGSRGPSSISHSNSSKDNLLDVPETSLVSNGNDIEDARKRLSNAELELEAIVSQMNMDNAKAKEANQNNNHSRGILDMNNSGDSENSLGSVNNSKYQKAVTNENGNTVTKNQNENDKINGNATYGGVVLKSTLRRKTPPKKNSASRPIPPPKPKSTITNMKKFQDEGVDGSEV